MKEFRDWVKFYSLEPWGDHRSDTRIGFAIGSLAQVLLGALVKNPPRLKPSDFIPQFENTAQSGDDIRQVLMANHPQGFVNSE